MDTTEPEKPKRLTKKQLDEISGNNLDGIAYFDEQHPKEPTQVRVCDDGRFITQHGRAAWILPANLDLYKRHSEHPPWKVWRTYATSGTKIPFTVRVRMKTVFVSFGRHRARYPCDNDRLQRILATLSQERATEYELIEADGDGSPLANLLREFLYQCVPDELKPNIKSGIKYRSRGNRIIISGGLQFKSDDYGHQAERSRSKTYHSGF